MFWVTLVRVHQARTHLGGYTSPPATLLAASCSDLRFCLGPGSAALTGPHSLQQVTGCLSVTLLVCKMGTLWPRLRYRGVWGSPWKEMLTSPMHPLTCAESGDCWLPFLKAEQAGKGKENPGAEGGKVQVHKAAQDSPGTRHPQETEGKSSFKASTKTSCRDSSDHSE